VLILKETLWINNVNRVNVVAMMCVNIIMVVITVSRGKSGSVTVTVTAHINALRTGIFFLYIYHTSLIRSEVTFL
jgi:hypothetical protein